LISQFENNKIESPKMNVIGFWDCKYYNNCFGEGTESDCITTIFQTALQPGPGNSS